MSADGKSMLAYLVAGAVWAALEHAGALLSYPLRPVPELVDGVVTGRIFLVDAVGRRRLVVDVLDAEPDA
jgi:hypothetical protein